MDTRWAWYMRLLRRESQAAFASRFGMKQGPYSRWESGEYVPTDAARVRNVAIQLGRNPLEAFVAAGMLTVEEAEAGLDRESRGLLKVLDRLHNKPVPRKFGRPNLDSDEALTPAQVALLAAGYSPPEILDAQRRIDSAAQSVEKTEGSGDESDPYETLLAVASTETQIEGAGEFDDSHAE